MKIPTRINLDDVGEDLAEMARETRGLGPPKPEMLYDCGDGSVQPVLTYPNPRLRDEAGEVEFDEELRQLIANMAITLYSIEGVGLAAPQIGVPARVFLVDLRNNEAPEPGKPRNQLLIAVNPKIWPLNEKTRQDAERCLSFPDVVEIIERPVQVIMKAYDHHGEPYALACSSDLSRAIQHEFDHLEGRLIIDHMSKKTAREVRKKLVLGSKRKRPTRRF